MKKAAYPGSFDPVSNGHLDIITRAASIFDELHIVVTYSIHKKCVFSLEERIEMVKKCTMHLKNVYVTSTNELTAKYCKKNDIQVLIRGLRNYQDYENEFSLFQYNRDILPGLETLLMFPSTKNQVISSSAVRELVTYGVDISPYVPNVIIPEIEKKFKKYKD